jgi:hypothetical protein
MLEQNMSREAGDIARNRQGRLNAASRGGYRSYIVSGPLMQLLTQVPPHARYCRPSGQTARRSLSDVCFYLGTSHCQRRPYERVNARSWPLAVLSCSTGGSSIPRPADSLIRRANGCSRPKAVGQVSQTATFAPLESSRCPTQLRGIVHLGFLLPPGHERSCGPRPPS